jgi:hypothetical protein
MLLRCDGYSTIVWSAPPYAHHIELPATVVGDLCTKVQLHQFCCSELSPRKPPPTVVKALACFQYVK